MLRKYAVFRSSMLYYAYIFVEASVVTSFDVSSCASEC